MFTKFLENMDIIAALDDEPNDVGGKTADELKAEFDKAGKLLKGYINDTLTEEMDTHINSTENPHSVTKEQVGLGKCDNTADVDKPVSTPQQTALDFKADKTNVLEKDNTADYTPTTDFNPATKKYVDNTTSNVVLGQIPDGTITFEKLNSELPKMLSSITATVPISSGQTLTAYDIVDIVNGKAEKNVLNELGTAQVFESAYTSYISAIALTDSKVLIAYRDSDNSNYGTAIVGIINGATITFGTAQVFESASTSFISTVALSDSKVLIAYQDEGNSNNGTAIVGTISGATITFGTAQVFENASSSYISVVALTNSKVLIAYRNVSNNLGVIVILTISDTTITVATSQIFKNGVIYYISAVALSDDKVLIAYQDEGNSSYGTAIVGTISGTAITFGTAQVFENAPTYDISAIALSDSKVLIAYRDSGNSNNGTAIVGTINGTTITFGTAQVFESASTYNISAVALTNSKVLIAYRDVNNSNYGTAIVGTINGTTITFGTAQVFENANSDYISTVALSDSKVLIAYRDRGKGDYGTAIVQQIDAILSKEAIVTSVDGSNCDVIYSGVHEDVNLLKGKTIKGSTNDSVLGYAPVDGKLAVQGYWERG